MLQLLVLLFHRINISRHMRYTSKWDTTNDFQLLNMTSGLPQNYEVPQDYGLCFYLDHKSSITLTMDGKKYKNPIFYCPGNASEIKFKPENAEIYYTEIFKLDWPYTLFNSLYIITKDSSIEGPKNEITEYYYSYYADLIVSPIPDLTYTVS